jgi:eukaryotic-like serine/threonine-protein kinase
MRDDATATEDQPDRTGSVLGGWHLVRLIGTGGMSSVYEGKRDASTPVAIKVLRPDLTLDRRARARFLREAKIANRIGHPGVATVLDSGEQDGSAFLAMDLLAGESLKERCAKGDGTLPANEVLRIADEVLDVLVASHALGIVHRDIKPANVFLTADGGVKLLDFGVARVREEHGASEISATRSGTTIGTPAFLSPEQAMGRSAEVDERTDLWAVGALMFFALTGRFVHRAETSNEYMILAATQPAPTLRSWAPHLARGVTELVDRALQLDKRKRWASAKDMQAAVRRVRAGGDAVLPGLRDEAATVPEPTPGRFPVRTGAAAIGAAAVLVAGSVWYLSARSVERAPRIAPAATASTAALSAPSATADPSASAAVVPTELPQIPTATTPPPRVRKASRTQRAAELPAAPAAPSSAPRPVLDVDDPSLLQRR